MARSFDGSSQYLHASSAVATAPPIAMSCWFWADPTIAQPGAMVTLARPNPGLDRFELRVDDSPAVVQVLTRDSSGFAMASSTTNYSTGAWHHAFGMWYSSTDRQVWLDGGGHASDGASYTPASIAETCLGASRITSPYSHFKGSLAEVAIWAGSGVANMGAAEATTLAQGFSPRCLGRWLPNLVFYRDLIRPTDRPGPGPSMTEVAAPAVVPHPRIAYPIGVVGGLFSQRSYLSPYRIGAGLVDGNSAQQALTTVAGAQHGGTFPIGEVSS